ncbi:MULTISPECIES: type IV secretion system protein VirB10 [Burkholderia]|jgi:type IV secretion system protein VirB10|uniref:Type IV secretion system protein VirB10 n=1 Tax=Burkholderia contaminans TaxID=488447 RepID=A0ABD7YG97_9BURK|nr:MULTISPECIES: type IV secretion system protein VirB10 [Burkholderia]MCA7912059.1 type IV secretion system protein VirB10 [Burkholderia contaminans]MCA8081358.1 type IV secretion system protein VirB10 [Burkholderia cepacia]WFN24031.1 type IV secretion system protein VirB10 [Burkholderia contaminans]VWD32732.1 conjugation TrbI family protein [Burkholderia contaminans]
MTDQTPNTVEPTEAARPPETGMEPRGIPGLARGKRKTNVRRVWIVLAVVVVLLLVTGSAAVFVKRAGDAYLEHKKAARDAPVKQATADPDLSGYKKKVEATEAASAAEAANAASSGLPEPAGARGAAPAAASGAPANGRGAPGAAAADRSGVPASAPESPADRRLSGDVLVKLGSSDGADSLAALQARQRNAQAGDQPAMPTSFARDGLDDSLAPSRLSSVKASFLPNLSLLLKRGKLIPCGQALQISTTYPGAVSCHVSEDVYSADGKTLLLERGSEATGEQRKAVLQGQASIFVVWTRIDTPKGVTIPLDSPATNALGATGIDADVDTHFWARFGGAILLSVIGDAGQALSNLTQHGSGTQIQFSNTSSGMQQFASEILRNTINIPPTAYSAHGSALNIFVARDVDFGNVYELVKQ